MTDQDEDEEELRILVVGWVQQKNECELRFEKKRDLPAVGSVMGWSRIVTGLLPGWIFIVVEPLWKPSIVAVMTADEPTLVFLNGK